MDLAQPRWALWLGWTAATALGFVFAFIVGEEVDRAFGLDTSVSIVLGLLAGAGVAATAQFVVLSTSVPRIRWHQYVTATVLGALAGLAIGVVFAFCFAMTIQGNKWGTDFGGGDITELLFVAMGSLGAITGAAIAIGQWMVLRPYIAKRNLWVITCAVASAMGYIMVVSSLIVPTANLIGIGLTQGIVVGAITGGAAALLIRPPDEATVEG